jgi:hypothetical protein
MIHGKFEITLNLVSSQRIVTTLDWMQQFREKTKLVISIHD